MKATIGLRPAVSDFAVAMETTLQRHDAKKGCEGWKQMTLAQLLAKLYEEYNELHDAILPLVAGDTKSSVARGKAIDEAVDVANILMMITDHLKEMK